MAIRWKPDTCKCVIDVIDWDTAQGRTISVCPAHIGLADDAQMSAVYLGENKVKNMALREIVNAAPELFLTSAQAAAQNRAQLLAWVGAPSPRLTSIINALSAIEAETAMRDAGLIPSHENQPMPGVRVVVSFGTEVGSARSVQIAVPALVPSERVAASRAITSLRLPVVVTVK